MTKKQKPAVGEMKSLASIKREARKSEDYHAMYSNDTQIQTTPWDVCLIFGVIELPPNPNDREPVMVINQVGEVRMSPQHAKRLLMILQAQLASYEQTVGPIPTGV